MNVLKVTRSDGILYLKSHIEWERVYNFIKRHGCNNIDIIENNLLEFTLYVFSYTENEEDIIEIISL